MMEYYNIPSLIVLLPIINYYQLLFFFSAPYCFVILEMLTVACEYILTSTIKNLGLRTTPKTQVLELLCEALNFLYWTFSYVNCLAK